MPIVHFNKATDPSTPDDVRVNTTAVRFVEAAHMEGAAQASIHLLGQGTTAIPVTEPVEVVVAAVEGLVAATRHYFAGQPGKGGSTVHIAPSTVSYLRPNVPKDPAFWIVCFVDAFELRIVAPLPAGL